MRHLLFRVKIKYILLFLLLPNFVFAIPIDNIESYSTGDLNTGNGGTGWTEAWGATDACNAVFDVQNSVAYTGSKAILANGGAVSCGRHFTADSTEDVVHTLYWRVAD